MAGGVLEPAVPQYRLPSTNRGPSHNFTQICIGYIVLQVERLDLLSSHVDATNFARTCMYLVSCCHYLPEPDDALVRVFMGDPCS